MPETPLKRLYPIKRMLPPRVEPKSADDDTSTERGLSDNSADRDLPEFYQYYLENNHKWRDIISDDIKLKIKLIDLIEAFISDKNKLQLAIDLFADYKALPSRSIITLVERAYFKYPRGILPKKLWADAKQFPAVDIDDAASPMLLLELMELYPSIQPHLIVNIINSAYARYSDNAEKYVWNLAHTLFIATKKNPAMKQETLLYLTMTHGRVIVHPRLSSARALIGISEKELTLLRNELSQLHASENQVASQMSSVVKNSVVNWCTMASVSNLVNKLATLARKRHRLASGLNYRRRFSAPETAPIEMSSALECLPVLLLAVLLCYCLYKKYQQDANISRGNMRRLRR